MATPPPTTADPEGESSHSMNLDESDSAQQEMIESESDYHVPPPFLPDQKVLCRESDDTYYRAVVRKMKAENQSWTFFIHYQGWNARWDRWVSPEDLKPDTPENREAFLTNKETPDESSVSTPASKKRKASIETGSGKKRKADNVSVAYRYKEFCELPFTLKTILVDEREKITRQGHSGQYSAYDCSLLPCKPARSVYDLPAPVTISNVLQHYRKKRGGAEQSEAKKDQVVRFTEGLGKLFEDALPVCLLYPQERPQYERLLNDLKQQEGAGKTVCDIYGCEYLLRLFVRLPVILQAEVNTESNEFLGPMLADLITLLQKNRQACFKSSFRAPKLSEYLNWEVAWEDKMENHSQDAPSKTLSSTP